MVMIAVRRILIGVGSVQAGNLRGGAIGKPVRPFSRACQGATGNRERRTRHVVKGHAAPIGTKLSDKNEIDG